MNLQQLEYIIAVDECRHFVRAAEKCCVTQSTLSIMIHKIEDELGVKIFDRAKQPVTTTKEGMEIIKRARRIRSEVNSMNAFASEIKGEISGTMHLGIIPTLAPYLLPGFIKSLVKKHPKLIVYIKELITDDIISKLNNGEIDVGIVAGPLNNPAIKETALFYEEFFVYASKDEKLPARKYLLPQHLNINHLWLMEEGHCMRNQVFNLCELRKLETEDNNLHYEAGSIESLINLVDQHEGITIIPHLASLHLNSKQKKKLREFGSPKPVRAINLATTQSFPRLKTLEVIKQEIMDSLPIKTFPNHTICKGVNPSNCDECTLKCNYRVKVSPIFI